MEAATLLQTKYPVVITLEDGLRATLRPLRKDDKVALVQFFQRLPAEDRFYLKDNVTSPEVVREWSERMDFERAIPIVAEAEGKIIGDATLHRNKSAARRHIGEIRVSVDADYRGRGLGTRLIQELIDLAEGLSLDGLVFELVGRRESAAIGAARRAGFVEATVLPKRVRDMYGDLQDLVIMDLSLSGRARIYQFLVDQRPEVQKADATVLR